MTVGIFEIWWVLQQREGAGSRIDWESGTLLDLRRGWRVTAERTG